MEIWRTIGNASDSALPGLIARAAEAGCTLVARQFTASTDRAVPDHDPGRPLLLWQEQDDARLRTRAVLAGADDIIGPWMDPDEALGRLLRLAEFHQRAAGHMVLGDLDIDLVDHSARRADQPLDLRGREYELLVHLARHCGRVQSREALLLAIWRLCFDPGTNVVQVHISRLRAKLDRDFAWPMLRTIRGSGYCLQAQA
ncbi:MAG TPA: response regulator transcription factor [Sphingobium sp.]|nr:response regulator transcription factor [Sphingobium sp.]